MQEVHAYPAAPRPHHRQPLHKSYTHYQIPSTQTHRQTEPPQTAYVFCNKNTPACKPRPSAYTRHRFHIFHATSNGPSPMLSDNIQCHTTIVPPSFTMVGPQAPLLLPTPITALLQFIPLVARFCNKLHVTITFFYVSKCSA